MNRTDVPLFVRDSGGTPHPDSADLLPGCRTCNNERQQMRLAELKHLESGIVR
ncbi:MAG: hypothetical protein ACLSVD_12020 [Eggerthellaceae bacterium]